jgi:predicted TPR repeat methyltransferase
MKLNRNTAPTASDFDPLVALFNTRRYAELETQVSALLAKHPNASFAWQLLGGALQMQGKDALAAFQKVAALSPNDAGAHFNLGVAYKSAGQLESAAVSYRRALTLKPDYLEAISNLGNVLQDLAQHDEAVRCYRRVLVINPTNADAYYKLGNLLRELGQLDEAVINYLQAVKFKPNSAQVHSDLGSALNKLGNASAASQHFQRAIEIDPQFAEAHYNLGNVFSARGLFEQAEASFRSALQAKPDFIEAHNNLGFMLRQQGRLEEAISSYRAAISLNPNYADAYGNLAGVLKIQGKFEEALSCYQQQAKLAPSNSVALHQIASLTGETTERAPSQYVENVFDGYAEKFDTHLQQALKYEAPRELVTLIKRYATLPAAKWNILDLGCGTGLVGAAIAPFSRQMVGVDLSTKMLAKARERNLYQRLEHLDLLTMMQAEKSASYDVIIAADVFVYLGKLDEIVCEIKRLLSPNGVFAFTVEDVVTAENEEAHQDTQPEYQLKNTGRYAHSTGYLTKLAATNNFLIQEMAATQIRVERNKPIAGHLVLLGGRS